MTGAELLVQILANHGVRHVFGVPGGQTLGFYNALARSTAGPRHVTVFDERSGAYAADAYARASGGLGVCDGTVGPGATNLVSGLAEAHHSSSPVLAIVSELKSETIHLREYGTASQGIDQRQFLDPVCKWVGEVRRVSELAFLSERAIRFALSGRPGPTAIIIPQDVFEADCEAVPSSFGHELDRQLCSQASEASVEAAVRLIGRSERPLLLAGGGVVRSGAFKEVEALADHLGMPVATTWTGKGAIREDHDLALGVLGNVGTPGAAAIARESDLVIMAGCKSSQNSTMGWQFPIPSQAAIHIDADPTEIGKVARTDVGLVGDARLVMQQILRALPARRSNSHAWATQISDARKQTETYIGAQQTSTARPIDPRRVTLEISKASGSEDLLVCDASYASGWGAIYYNVRKSGSRLIFPRGMAGLGFGLPAALGAALAAEPRPVFLIVGDGALAYSVQELAVAVKQRLPIKVIVLNNTGYSWIQHSQKSRFKGELSDSVLPDIDYSKLADALGCASIRIDDPEQLHDCLSRARASDGPYLVEVITSSTETPVLKQRADSASGETADPYAVAGG